MYNFKKINYMLHSYNNNYVKLFWYKWTFYFNHIKSHFEVLAWTSTYHINFNHLDISDKLIWLLNVKNTAFFISVWNLIIKSFVTCFFFLFKKMFSMPITHLSRACMYILHFLVLCIQLTFHSIHVIKWRY